jgi:magnesium-transporting ATPase (P-type)
MDDFIKETQGNHRNRNILIAVILAAGTLLTGILIRHRRKQQMSGASRPVKKKLLEKIKGLSEDEAEARLQPDLDNSLSFKPVRSRREIWRENILSIFNLSLVGLALVQLLFDRPLDALLSLGVLGLNIGINVFQEYFARLRLKDILEETRPRVTVIRDQTTRSIDANDLVIDDMVAFGPGDELLADGTIVHQDELVVDESMIGDGDRRAVKGQGDAVFAGSFCVSGHAVYQVEKTGADRYITKLIENSRQTGEELTPIEIIIGNVLRVLLVIVAVFTGVLIYRYLNIELPISDDFFNEVAGIIFSIAPAGLFFMIIVTYAASTVDLAKFGALVHRARSVEAMAQVNTICFSREGVLTGTKLDLNILPQGGENESIPQSRIQQILGDYVRSSAVNNKITRTIRNNFPGSARKTLDEAPYLSIYGWSAINFDDPDLTGTYLLGIPAALEPYLNQVEAEDEQEEAGGPSRTRRFASRLGGIFRRSKEDPDQENEPDNLEQPLKLPKNQDLQNNDDLENADSKEVDAETKKPGMFRRFLTRVGQLAQADALEEDLAPVEQSDPPIELIFAYYPDPSLLFDEDGRPQFPIPLTPLCELSFSEQVRPESVSVIKNFHEDGIGVKIFAAERPNQVIELLKKAGLSEKSLNTISGADLSLLDAAGMVQAAEDNGIFLDLTPEQMGQIVAALRAKGQYVAMVGDAVSDVPALREANLAASYKGSSPAAQSVADILLLENTLRVLNRVLDKGQRIVNGLLDILKLYLTQASYLSLMIVGIALIGVGFPVRGIQLTIITTVTITIPSLGLTLWANPGVLYGNSLRKSLSHFILPAATTIAIAGIFAFFTFGGDVLEREYSHLTVTYTLVFTGLLVVLFLRPPFRLLVGGSSLSADRRIFMMVVVLTVLFFITVALSSAIASLNDLLLLDWLNPLTDYVSIAAIVVVWAVSLLLIWRIWRIPGLEINGDTSSEKKAENHTPGKSDADQSEEELPQPTD